MSHVRKLDNKPWPQGFEQKVNIEKSIAYFNDEQSLIEFFLAKIAHFDPDLLIGHNLCQSYIELLLARI